MDKEKKFNKIMLILFCIGLELSSVTVGVPFELYNTTQLISLYFSMLTVIYFIYYLINKRKINFKITIMDILACIFCLTPIIPFITNTYVTTSGTVKHIIMYITIFDIYYLARLLSTNNNDFIEYIIDTIIFSASIMVIYGIDNMTVNIFQKFIKSNAFYFYDFKELRMEGFFRYANTFGVYMAFAYILSIYKILKSEKNKLFSMTSILFMYATILANSRLLLILFCLSLIVILILTKDNKNKILLINSIVLDICLGLMLANFTMQQIYMGNIITIYLILIMILLIKLFLYIFISKLKIKNMLISIILIIVTITAFIIIALNTKCGLIMFTTKNSVTNVKRDLLGVQSNTKYKFDFDVNCYTNKSNNYGIDLIEKDSDFQDIAYHELNLDICNAEKTIEFTTSENTNVIYICFKTREPKDNQYFIVNSMKINGEKRAINYLLIPESFLNRTSNINTKTKSASQRKIFIEDALKLISKNWKTGIGGDGWKYTYKDVQQTQYSSTDTHSYITKITLEFGIISLIAYLAILIITIKYVIKQKEYYNIYIALFLIIAHSLLDIDMSYMFILIIVFITIAIATTNYKNCNKVEKEKSKKHKIKQFKNKILENRAYKNIYFIIASTIIIVSLLLNIGQSISKIITLKEYTDYYQKLNMYRLASKWSPYDKYYLQQKIKLEEIFKELSDKDELNLDKEKLYRQEPKIKPYK